MKETKVLEFGEQQPLDYVPGAEALKDEVNPEDQGQKEGHV